MMKNFSFKNKILNFRFSEEHFNQSKKMIQMEPVSLGAPNGESIRDDDYRQRILASM